MLRLGTQLIRQFSRKNLMRAEQKLQRVLHKQIKANEALLEEAQELAELAQLKGFTIQDVEGALHVELHKKQEDTQVMVQFRARAITQKQSESESEDNDLLQDKMKDEDGTDYEDVCYFTVFLKREEECVAYECMGVDQELVVNHVVNLGGDMENYRWQTRLERDTYQYLGPDFSSLDMHLQAALRDYLACHGVDQQLTSLVMEYSLLKDARLYLHWAKTMHSFLS